MKKQILFVPILAIGLALALTTAAMALTQEGSDARKEAIEQMKEEKAELHEEMKEKRDELKEERNEFREEVKQQMIERRCERWENRIRTRINRYENNQQQHERVFGNMVDRLEKVAQRLKDAGLDTTDLNSYIAELEGKINALMSEHEAFIDQLKDADKQSCGDSEGEFKNQLGEARRMIPKVRSALDDVRDYYRDVVRPELIELKKQLIDEEASEASEASETSETKVEVNISEENVEVNIEAEAHSN